MPKRFATCSPTPHSTINTTLPCCPNSNATAWAARTSGSDSAITSTTSACARRARTGRHATCRPPSTAVDARAQRPTPQRPRVYPFHPHLLRRRRIRPPYPPSGSPAALPGRARCRPPTSRWAISASIAFHARLSTASCPFRASSIATCWTLLTPTSAPRSRIVSGIIRHTASRAGPSPSASARGTSRARRASRPSQRPAFMTRPPPRRALRAGRQPSLCPRFHRRPSAQEAHRRRMTSHPFAHRHLRPHRRHRSLSMGAACITWAAGTGSLSWALLRAPRRRARSFSPCMPAATRGAAPGVRIRAQVRARMRLPHPTLWVETGDAAWRPPHRGKEATARVGQQRPRLSRRPLRERWAGGHCSCTLTASMAAGRRGTRHSCSSSSRRSAAEARSQRGAPSTPAESSSLARARGGC